MVGHELSSIVDYHFKTEKGITEENLTKVCYGRNDLLYMTV